MTRPTLADFLQGRRLNQPQAETTYGPFGERYQVEQWQPPGGIDPLAMLPVARLGTVGRGATGLADTAWAMLPGMSGATAAQHWWNSRPDLQQGATSAAEGFNPIGAIPAILEDARAVDTALGTSFRNRNADAGERYRLEQEAKARLNQRYGLFDDELREMERAKEYGSAGY